MVERNEKFALQHGYLILNTRTNSRIWYPAVLEAKKNNPQGYDPYKHLTGGEAHEVKNSARNGAIQGTQADMLKELMVEIHKEAIRQDFYGRFNFALLGQVHDETIYRTNDIETLVEFNEDDGEIEMVTVPEFIKRMHSKIPNRYLSFIKMTAEQHVGKTWTK